MYCVLFILVPFAKVCSSSYLKTRKLAFRRREAHISFLDIYRAILYPNALAELGRQGHYGLANMRERANKVGGRVRLAAAPGKGTRIELTVHAGEEQNR